MRALLIILFLGVASAALVTRDEYHPRKTSDQHAASQFGDFLKDAVDNLVDRIKDTVDKIRDAADKITDKVVELGAKLRELEEKTKSKSKETVERLKEKVQEIVQAIRDSINQQVAAIRDDMDVASKVQIRDLVAVIKSRIADRVESIRNYVKEHVKDSKTLKEFEDALANLKDSDLSRIFGNIWDLKKQEITLLKEAYQRLKELAAKADGELKQKIESLLSYVETFYKNGVDRALDNYQNLKARLLEVVDKTKDFSMDAAKDALNRLHDYKEHLGELYTKLVEGLKETLKQH